jgi:hypothetical protein
LRNALMKKFLSMMNFFKFFLWFQGKDMKKSNLLQM